MPAPSCSTNCSAPTPRSTGWPTWSGNAPAATPSSSKRSSRAWSRTAACIGGRGAYELVEPSATCSIPATVQAVLAARIDRLPERDKALLQTAPVIGRQFSGPPGRPGRRPAPTHELEAALRSLVDAEFVYETATYPEEEYAFKHALTEEVAYRSQLAKHRARTHAAVAGALAEVDADKLDERASLIAHHYELGGELLEAARWNARAATWAGISHPVEATRHWRLVRALTDRLGAVARDRPAGPERPTAAARPTTGGSAPPARRATSPMRTKPPRCSPRRRRWPRRPARRRDAGLRPHRLRRGRQILSDARSRRATSGSVAATRLADETGDPALRTVTRILLDWGLFVLGRIREATAVTREMEAIIGEDRSIGREMLITSPYA